MRGISNASYEAKFFYSTTGVPCHTLEPNVVRKVLDLLFIRRLLNG